MDCDRVRQVMFLFIDNELEETLLVSFREHLAGCSCCTQEMDHTRRLLSLVRERCTRAPAPQRLRDRILTSLPHRAGGRRETWE